MANYFIQAHLDEQNIKIKITNYRKVKTMQINQQSNRNKQSFGMAWQVEAKSFAKANEGEMQKLKDCLTRCGSRLDDVTRGVETYIEGGVINGKIKTLALTSVTEPKTIKEGLGIFCKSLADIGLAILTVGFYKPKYGQILKFKDLSDDKLITAATDTVKGAIKRFTPSL